MTRIAFYAPLKPADHRIASGDRTVARLFLTALKNAGFEPHVASRLRARVGKPDSKAMRRRRERGLSIASEIVRFWRRLPEKERPALWFTYHVYYKAVDWIGPEVARALSIPYVIAEASHAPKRAQGPWAANHEGAAAAMQAADRILCLNPEDKECLRQIVSAEKLADFPPFLDFADAPPLDRGAARRSIARRHDLNPDARWLLAVAMMREGDKLQSYRVLGEALHLGRFADCPLIVIGDGPAKREVKKALSGLKNPVVWAGFQPAKNLRLYYTAADLLVWPAIKEAFGMALLEAQAEGLPVVAGASGGVPAIVEDGKSGFLAPPGDARAFAALLSRALASDLEALRKGARANANRRHGMNAAVKRLTAIFAKLGVTP